MTLHLDAAGCSRLSPAVLAAVTAHLEREAEVGYAAETEAAPAVDGLRAGLARVLGVEAGEVALTENATKAFSALLAAWPLRQGGRIGVVRSEYGSNRMALRAIAAAHGCHLVELACDGDGRLDLEELERTLIRGLELVTFPHVASHRGVVQPAQEAGALCATAHVPLVLDVAQTAGHVDVRGSGATALVGTSRKWLGGPRGVGFLAVVGEAVRRMRPPVLDLTTGVWQGEVAGPAPGVHRFAAGETSIAARVGLAAAVEELLEAGLDDVHRTLAEHGPAARRRLDGAAGWRVGEPVDEPSAMVTLRHPTADPTAVQRRLYDDGIIVSGIPVSRAPYDLGRPLLRASFGASSVSGDAERLAQALERATPAA